MELDWGMAIRDRRIDERHVREDLQALEGFLPRFVEKMMTGATAAGRELRSASKAAEQVAAESVRAARHAYTLGMGATELTERVVRACSLREEAFGVLLRREWDYPGNLWNGYGFRDEVLGSYRDTVDMLSWAVLLRDRSVAEAEYGLPHVRQFGDEVLDTLASFAGLTVTDPPRDHLAIPPFWERWIAVVAASPAQRPALFDDYVRGWRDRFVTAGRMAPAGDEYDKGAWCFDGAALAVGLDLDDSGVRDVPKYPADLVDHARSQA
jgi:hypothetical protein